MKRTSAMLIAAWLIGASASAQPAAEQRIEPLPESQWSESLRPAAAEFAPLGMPNLVATYANHPVLAQALLPHLRYVWTESTLPDRHRALLGLRTAWLTRSAYLWAHRAALARRDGFSEDDLERVMRGPEAAGWDDFETAVLRAADELYVDSFISDATWETLETRYDLAQMIDTIDTVGALIMHAGALNSIGVDVEPSVSGSLPTIVPYSAAAERTNLRLVGREPRIPPTPPENGGPITANVFNTFVHNPRADRVRGAINSHVNSRATLEPEHRELLLIRIGVLCRSEYEYAAHVRVGLRVGLSPADIETILAGPEAAEPGSIERALLGATDELYDDDRISAETWNALATSLDTEQLLDMLIAVGGYRSTSLLINSAGVQLDENMADFRFPEALR